MVIQLLWAKGSQPWLVRLALPGKNDRDQIVNRYIPVLHGFGLQKGVPKVDDDSVYLSSLRCGSGTFLDSEFDEEIQ